jgi:hypothetical protein
MSMDDDQVRLLEEYTKKVKEQGFYMKRAIVSEVPRVSSTSYSICALQCSDPRYRMGRI